MKKNIVCSAFSCFVLLAVVALFASCGPNREELKEKITAFESTVSELDCEMDTNTAREIVGLYTEYANHFPDDSLSPVYLFKAADVLQGICDYSTSIQYFDRIIEQYASFDGLPLCYFFKGRAYEQAEDYPSASACYEEFLKRYPDHFLANDTRTILPLVKQGMNDEAQLDFLMSHTTDTLISQNE